MHHGMRMVHFVTAWTAQVNDLLATYADGKLPLFLKYENSQE
jgi:hypothetical protein